MRKTLVFTVLAFTILCTKLQAQWSQVGYMINGTDTSSGSHFIKGFGSNLFCGTSKGLFKSSNNGNSWTNLTVANAVTLNQDIYSVLVANNGHMYTGSDKRVFKSTDGGLSWTWLNVLPDSATYYDIAEINGNIVLSYAKGTTNGVYYSSNAGASWTAATGITSGVRYFLLSGSTLYLGGTANGVYKSTDNGQSWSISGSGFPVSAGIWGVISSGNKLFANSVSGKGLFESANNGATWISSSPTLFNGFCQVFSLASHISIIVASNDGACNPGATSSLRISYNYGLSWTDFLTGTTAPYYFPVLGTNSNGTSFFTKSGNGKEVYRYDLIDAIKKNEHNDNLSVFPNPTTGKIKCIIQKRLIGQMDISIFNGTGETVYTSSFSNHENELDLSGLPKGIYTIKLSGKEYLSTKRVVLE